MSNEKTKRPRVYFADIQRTWSIVQVSAAQEMIEGLSRHENDGYPLDGPKDVVQNAA